MNKIRPVLTEGQKIPRTHYDAGGMNGDLMASAQFLGLSPQRFLQDIGLMKANGKNDNSDKSPGVAGLSSVPNVIRGFVEPTFDTHSAKGIRENYQPIAFSILREIERKNPIVSAITNTRAKQLRPFAQESKGDDEPGFRIVTRDPEHKPTKHEKEQCKDLMNWFKFTGRTDFLGAEDREDDLLDIMLKMSRDYHTIDQVAIELRRDRGNKIVDFWALDGATIWRVLQGGYRGGKNDFDPRSHVIVDENVERDIVEKKLALIPEVENIRFIQRLHGKLTAAFTHKDMIFDNLQKRSDIRFYGYGYPPLEQAMNACTAFLFGMAYNAEAFNSGTLPKIALAFKDGNFSTSQLMALQDEWISNFRGIHGAWRIPMLNHEVNVIDLYKSARDMEYMKYLEFMASLICAVMGIDTMELGLRFQQAQNVLSENQGSRLSFSKDRGLNDQLGGMSGVWNKVLMRADTKLAARYKFEYTGIEVEDKEKASKIKGEEVKTRRTVNELRAEGDDPPLPHGDIILDPTYLQYIQGKEAEAQAQAQEQEMANGTENVFSEAVDEVTDDMFKAKVSRDTVRTLLI